MSDRRARPIYATRYREHDDPPASGLYSPPGRRRYRRTVSPDLALNDGLSRSRDTIAPSLLRRRRRSSSIDDEDRTYPAAERRREYDSLRQVSNKRRRLDTDTYSCPPIKYGFYGQVEPGRLKMMLVSCDGGEYTDPTNPRIYLGPHNVLKADRSVYSSERKKASIMLRHADDTPFSVTQISIVAPEHGFTNPVKTGIAYVAMNLEHLKKYTDKVSPALGAVHDLDHLDAERPRSSLLASPAIRLNGDEGEQPRPVSSTASGHIPYTILYDADLGAEDPTDQQVADYRLARMQQSIRRQDDRRWRDRRLHRALPLVEPYTSFMAPPLEIPRERTFPPQQWDSASDDDDTDTVTMGTMNVHHEQDQMTFPGAYDLQPGNIDVTCAPFYIRHGKHYVTINFEVPMSGRYILLKLDGVSKAENVDIQTILITGYAGPRFYPAFQPM